MNRNMIQYNQTEANDQVMIDAGEGIVWELF